MDENANPINEYSQTQPAGGAGERTPYRRQVPHITQEPIDDVEPQYVTRERYVTLEESRAGRRRHMGTAVSDPDYLTQPGSGATGAGTGMSTGASGQRTITHSGRYLQTPKPGKSIFTSQKARARKHTRRLVAALILLAVIVVVIVLFFIR